MKHIKDILLSHLAVEYNYNSYINEDIILEKYGVYNGCEKLAVYIDSKLSIQKNKITIYSSELNDFDNIFFNSITVNLIINKNLPETAEYKLGNTNDIIINVTIKRYRKNSILDLLIHELVHAYDDYILSITNNTGLKDMAKTKKYKRISSKINNQNKQFLRDFLYITLNYETKAFIGQLKGELLKNKNVITGPNDALCAVKSTKIYKCVEGFGNLISDYKNGSLKDNEINELYTEYIHIINADNKFNELFSMPSKNKMFKELEYKYQKVTRKITKIIPKMCIEILNNEIDLKIN